MLSAKWDLFTFLIIALIVFSTSPIAADQNQALPESQTLTGQLDILVADNFETGVSQRRYALRVRHADGSYRMVSLSFASVQPDITLKSGEQITVEGRWIDDVLTVDSISYMSQNPSGRIMRTAAANEIAPLLIGDRKAIVIILNMRDVNSLAIAENPYNRADLISMMYTGAQNVKSLYEASSYQQLSFDPNTDGTGGPDVFGPYTIDYNANDDLSTKNNSLNTILNDWATQADDAARQAGINIDQYQHHIYFLPNQIYNDWVGMGTEGCPNDFCRAWVIKSNTYSDEGRFVAHELGHNLGWRHAAKDLNDDGVIRQSEDYADQSGIMGWPVWAQANAPHRDQLAWFDAYPGALARSDCSGTYELYALELDPGVDTVGTQVVKIRKRDTNDYYYLSYRRQIGPYPSHSQYVDKINIHRYDGNGTRTYHITDLEQNGVFEDTVNEITVTATSAGSATATVTVDIRNRAPEASFSHTLIDGHLSVQFTNNSIDDYNSIASYLWEMDGKTFTRRDAKYTFPDTGTYPVKLTVTDACGNSREASYSVAVIANKPPTADFSSAADHLVVQFSNNSNDSDGDIASYLWDFGDNTTSEETSPSHTYAQSGTYEVTLTVTDDDGDTGQMPLTIQVEANKPPEADFSSSANGLDLQFSDTSSDPDGNIASHLWDFGDGATSAESDPRHTYAAPGTYTVTLTVTDDDGAKDTRINKEVTVSIQNVAPAADFIPKADRLSVVFTDASTDSDGSITSHQWNFGDNTTSIEASPNHIYASAGTYTVTLTVTDNHGATDTASKQITVDVTNVPPAAAFTYTSDGLEIQFSDTSTDSDGQIVSHQWEFGDGTTSTETSPVHTYTSADTYAVKLTVTDDDGETNTFTENIDVDLISPLVVPPNPGGGGGGGGGCFIGHLF